LGLLAETSVYKLCWIIFKTITATLWPQPHYSGLSHTTLASASLMPLASGGGPVPGKDSVWPVFSVSYVKLGMENREDNWCLAMDAT